MTNLVPLTSALVTVDTPAVSPLSQRLATTAQKARETHVEKLKESARTSYANWRSAIEKGLATAADEWFHGVAGLNGLRTFNGHPFEFPREAQGLEAMALIVLNLPPQTRGQDYEWSVKLMAETMRPELEREGFTFIGCGLSGGQHVAIIASPELAEARRGGLA